MDMLQSLGMSKDLIADLLINIVSIIVLYLVVKKLAYNPVKKFLDARKERVEAQKAVAEESLKEATEMKEKYDELLKDSENAKADAIKEGINNAKAEAAEILDSAREQAKAIVDKANKNAKEKEQELIKFYDSKNSGYNLTDGGDGIIGYHHSEETKRKISNS